MQAMKLCRQVHYLQQDIENNLPEIPLSSQDIHLHFSSEAIIINENHYRYQFRFLLIAAPLCNKIKYVRKTHSNHI